jgi:hypothetical protein
MDLILKVGQSKQIHMKKSSTTLWSLLFICVRSSQTFEALINYNFVLSLEKYENYALKFSGLQSCML